MDYDVRVADHHIWQYHRENGFTKIGFRNPVNGHVQGVLRVMEGQVEAAHIINKAYINENFPNTRVVTGVNFYPFKFAVSMIIDKVQSIGAVIVGPVALMMGFPVFLF